MQKNTLRSLNNFIDFILIKYNINFLLILNILSFNMLRANLWQIPDSSLRYDQVVFLTSHNSYAAKNHGYLYAQQKWTIKEQLRNGVRGLMLDTYRSRSICNGDRIVLCHGGPLINRIITGSRKPMKFVDSLIDIKDFMEENPYEIITIFLENYVKDENLIDQDFEEAGLSSMILKPDDWDPDLIGSWPTLQWMQDNNKRLVIFNSLGRSRYAYNEWEQVIENQYGTLDLNKASVQRKESILYNHKDRNLLLINYIPTFKLNLGGAYKNINSKKLRKLLAICYSRGLDKDGYAKCKLPNFINVDFVDEGKCLDYVNSLNRAIVASHISF